MGRPRASDQHVDRQTGRQTDRQAGGRRGRVNGTREIGVLSSLSAQSLMSFVQAAPCCADAGGSGGASPIALVLLLLLPVAACCSCGGCCSSSTVLCWSTSPEEDGLPLLPGASQGLARPGLLLLVWLLAVRSSAGASTERRSSTVTMPCGVSPRFTASMICPPHRQQAERDRDRQQVGPWQQSEGR